MKALTAELNANEIDIKAKDCIVDELKTTLTDTRKELNKQVGGN